ncbi:MAG: ATP-binding protein [Geobacter sp.]|nr:ATP-binding protein [Geobacter sp.]
MQGRPNFRLGRVAATTVPASTASLWPVQAWVSGFARCFGLADEEIRRLELVVEEALMSVLHTSFDRGESGDVTVQLDYRPGQFVIAIEDKGLPLDLAYLEANEAISLNLTLIRQLVDELVFVNKGKEGKRLELITLLPAENVAVTMDEQQQGAAEVAEQEGFDSAEISFRMLRADETLALAQLAYRSYGYTYVSDFYFPERIRERVELGLMETCVALMPDNRIVGALSLFYDSPDAKVAESGAAMVDPRCRGKSLFKEMKQFLFAYGRQKGLYGIYSEAVTIHPYTQQGNLSLGAHETGMLLSYVSENVAFKKIGSELMGQRQSLILFYARLNPEPARTVYTPARYADLLRQVYQENGLNRELLISDQYAANLGQDTQLEIQVRHDAFNDAIIDLQRIGSDADAIILQHTRELCEKKVEAIYLNLELSDPAAACLAGRLAERGYLFAGVIPELRNGDLLKLQYLNNVVFDPARVTAVSPVAQTLLAFITNQYHQRP